MGGINRARQRRRTGAALIKVAASVCTVATALALGLLFCHARKNTVSSRYHGASSGVSSGGWTGYEGGGVVRLSSPPYAGENQIVLSAPLQEASPRFLRAAQPPSPQGSESKNIRGKTPRPAPRGSAPGTSEDRVSSGVAKAPRRSFLALLSPRSILRFLTRVIGFFCGDTSEGSTIILAGDAE